MQGWALHFPIYWLVVRVRARLFQLSPRSLEAFDGPHDLWEEAAKESLELLLDADNQPMLLLDRYMVWSGRKV